MGSLQKSGIFLETGSSDRRVGRQKNLLTPDGLKQLIASARGRPGLHPQWI